MNAIVGMDRFVDAEIVEKPCLPTFKRPWYLKPDRLDAQPVCWSLYAHPEEWKWTQYGDNTLNYHTITHIPSQHQFWVGSGKGYYGLWDTTECSCSSNRHRFHFLQQRLFHAAFNWWRAREERPRLAHTNAQFAAHFVH
jgi:hypothetical protein